MTSAEHAQPHIQVNDAQLSKDLVMHGCFGQAVKQLNWFTLLGLACAKTLLFCLAAVSNYFAEFCKLV